MQSNQHLAGRRVAAAVISMALTVCARPLYADPTWDLHWVTVGDPGNRATIPEEVPDQPQMRVGAVGYSFRITDTKLTNAQYADFTNAYAPYYNGGVTGIGGRWLARFTRPDGTVGYRPRTGTENYAATISWEMAARVCNWLQNGQVNERWAFETGVYDTSTFRQGPDGYEHQLEPAPGARYWIPSQDEWVKAAHYDPNRYGQGDGGYWMYPDQGNEPLIVGLPDEGGETIGDLNWNIPGNFGWRAWDVLQYSEVRSYYGLMDVSGTTPDWTSTARSLLGGLMVVEGSMAGDAITEFNDRLEYGPGAELVGNDGGLRIASIVPAPGGLGVVVLGIVCLNSRRRS
jgi:hypothetical protein